MGARLINIDASRVEPMTASGPAQLFMLDFQVANDAPAGSIPIDPHWAALKDRGLRLIPNPQAVRYLTDGAFVAQAPLPVASATRQTVAMEQAQQVARSDQANLDGGAA